MEEFALARDREAVLRQLVAGSDQYYFLHCLHYQNTRQFTRAEETLDAWIQRHGRGKQVRKLQNRQALLQYESAPEATFQYLQRELKLSWPHRRRSAAADPSLPSVLPREILSRENLAQRGFAGQPKLDGFEDRALDWLAETDLSPSQIRALLERVNVPDLPDLVGLIASDLQRPDSGGFGSLSAHHALTLAQLEQLQGLLPQLRDHPAMVEACLRRLSPPEDQPWQAQLDLATAYLERLWDYLERLGEQHNSLKAHVLYHLLEHAAKSGSYDRERLLAYLRLPRESAAAPSGGLDEPRRRQVTADLHAAYETGFPPVVDDTPLVIDYLGKFFSESADYTPFLASLEEAFLRRAFGQWCVMEGVGDPEQWASLLTPAELAQLKERVCLDFVPQTAASFAADAEVALELDVKGVDSLFVRVFEINAANYYKSERREIDAAIDLDGMVANHERHETYEASSLRKVRRRFEFPELKRPGVFVIDFIGGGKRSRAVVRKGALRSVRELTADGHELQVYDQRNQLVRDAVATIGARSFEADAEGRIRIPFSHQAARVPLVLSQGEVAALEWLEHLEEDYRLTAGIHLQNEAVLSGESAAVLVRPVLMLNRIPVSLDHLYGVRLELVAEDWDGDRRSFTADPFPLTADREAVFTFRVPDRLRSITATLKAKVDIQATGEPRELEVSQTFAFNTELASGEIAAPLLTRDREGYRIDLRGRTGEPLGGVPLEISCKHEDLREPVRCQLATDAEGSVRLGPLPGVRSLQCSLASELAGQWTLSRDSRVLLPARIQLAVGETATIPTSLDGDQLRPSHASLLELRGHEYLADRFSHLSLVGQTLKVSGLPAGEYQLRLKREDATIRLSVSEGAVCGQTLLQPHRQLTRSAATGPVLESLEVAGDELVISCSHGSPAARVHLFGTCYEPSPTAFDDLAAAGRTHPTVTHRRIPECHYQSGVAVGDEYQYIIERRYRRKFPGNMLARPSLLLNPWEQKAATPVPESPLAAPEAFAAAEAADAAEEAGFDSVCGEPEVSERHSCLEFLARPALVTANLRMDHSGQIRVPLETLAGYQVVHAVLVDGPMVASRTLPLAARQPQVRDLRLSSCLPADACFAQCRAIEVLPASQRWELALDRGAAFNVYDHLGAVYRYLGSVSPEPSWDRFRFLLQWHQLSPEERAERYGEVASHELHLFLYLRDPEFFASAIEPYLHQKLHKTFVDRWLLGLPLDEFREPARLQTLNTFERILLCRRDPQLKDAVIRQLEDYLQRRPLSPSAWERLFQTALKCDELDQGAEASGRRGGRRGMREMTFGMAQRFSPGLIDEMHSANKRSDGGAGAGGSRRLSRSADAPLFRPPKPAKEWAESNYYRVAAQNNQPQLVPPNRFWLDYARHQGDGAAFLSPHFIEATSSLTEKLLALSVLDLPASPPENALSREADRLVLRSPVPVLIAHEQILPSELEQGEASVLISQHLFRSDDRYETVEGQKVEKYLEGELATRTVYGFDVVVTNPSSAPSALDLLVQLPEGSIGVGGERSTESVPINVPAFGTHCITREFYFPAEGVFQLAAAQAARHGRVLATATPRVLDVVAQPRNAAAESWPVFSQEAPDDAVLDYLKTANLQSLDLDQIAFRMHDARFFAACTAILDERLHYHRTLWSYAVKHRDPRRTRQFLENERKFRERCGFVSSPLLDVAPVESGWYQQLEYWPLTHPRVHPLPGKKAARHEELAQQFARLVEALCYRESLSQQDRLMVACYLVALNRIEEAIEFYETLSSAPEDSRLQYDYLSAYLQLTLGNPAAAARIAQPYAAYPIVRWRDAFQSVLETVSELGDRAGPSDDDRRPDQPVSAANAPGAEDASSAAMLEFEIEGTEIHVRHRGIAELRVNYYEMDVELLFSRNPFAQEIQGQFAHVRANRSEHHRVPAGETRTVLPIPPELTRQDALVEVQGGQLIRAAPRYAHSLAVEFREHAGELQVRERERGGVLPGVYVKVYARHSSRRGEAGVRFFKDGYTDLRGRFDYASHQHEDLRTVTQFAILVASEEHGCTIREISPPTS